MTAPREGLRERQKRRRRERMYHAALELFHEKGFYETTVEDIAAKSHVSRGTFFNYFPYKEAVLLEYGRALMEDAFEEARRALEAGADPVEALYGFWRRLAELSEAELGRDLLAPLAHELVNPDPERAEYAYRTLPLASKVKQFLRPLKEAGRLRQDMSLERIAASLADAYLLAALRWAAYGAGENLAEETEKFLKVALEGVLAR